jgi:hypothetical protein
MAAATDRPNRVSSLLGSKHIDTAIECLGSLRRYSREPVELRLHDDGTLQPADRDRLLEAFGNPQVISPADADDQVAHLLVGRPILAATRKVNPFVRKLIDIPAFCDGGELIYCDTDVRFMRPFTGLFEELPSTHAACFMKDIGLAYSIRSWNMLRYGIQMPSRANTGLFQFRMQSFDPDHLEWFLARPELQTRYNWIEQTCWALMVPVGKCLLYDPSQVAIPDPGKPLDPAIVAYHFVTAFRYRLDEAGKMPSRTDEDAPVAIRRVPSARQSVLDAAVGEARRFASNYLPA